jgi:serine/threonine-protein kinase HipA
MKAHPDFADIGKRMLLAWHEGVSGLRDKRMYAMGGWQPGDAMTGFSDPPKLEKPKTVIGRSELLGKNI